MHMCTHTFFVWMRVWTSCFLLLDVAEFSAGSAGITLKEEELTKVGK